MSLLQKTGLDVADGVESEVIEVSDVFEVCRARANRSLSSRPMGGTRRIR